MLLHKIYSLFLCGIFLRIPLMIVMIKECTHSTACFTHDRERERETDNITTVTQPSHNVHCSRRTIKYETLSSYTASSGRRMCKRDYGIFQSVMIIILVRMLQSVDDTLLYYTHVTERTHLQGGILQHGINSNNLTFLLGHVLCW